MFCDWRNGDYFCFQVKMFFFLIVVILYIVMLFDIILDVIFGFGIIDDVVVLGLIWMLIKKEML